MAERSIRDFQVPFPVAPVADAWASANGFALSEIEADGSRHYVRGSGLLTGQMMCVVRQAGLNVRVEGYIHARLIARASALFLIPADKSIEPGGFVGALPRQMARNAVDKLLAQLGQPPITSADNAAATVSAAVPAGSAPGRAVAAPVFKATDMRPLGILVLAIAEVVNALICLTVALDFWDGFNWRTSYDEMDWAMVDLVMTLAYLALVAGSVAVAWRLWSMRKDAWLAAIALSGGVIGVTVVSALIWGLDGLGIVGIVVHLGILAYLNMTPVRSLFGRGPLSAFAS